MENLIRKKNRNSIASEGITPKMEIEQTSPNKPNFLLVVLAAAMILVILVLALFFVDIEGGHLTFRHHTRHPTSMLMPQPQRFTLS